MENAQEKAPPPKEMSYLPPLAQIDVQDEHVINHKPLEINLNQDVLNFELKNVENMSVMDLGGVKMRVTCELRNDTTNALLNAAEVQAAPSNNFIHTLFSTIQVQVGNKIVSSQDFRYPVRAWIAKMEQMTQKQMELEFETTGFIIEKNMEHEPGDVTHSTTTGLLKLKQASFATDPGADADVVGTVAKSSNTPAKLNDLFIKRRAATNTNDGKQHIFEDHIYEVPFTSNDYLPYGVEVKVTFTRQANKKYALKGDNDYSVVIKDFQLVVPYKKLSLKMFTQIEQKISQKAGLDIWLNRYVIDEKSIVNDHSVSNFTDLFANEKLGLLPERLLFTVVTNNMLHGEKDTFNFQFNHADLKRFSVLLPGGKLRPPLDDPEYDFPNGTTEIAYKQFVKLLNLDRDGHGSMLTESIFVDSQALFGLRLTPTPTDDQLVQPTGMGHVQITIQWTTQTSANKKLLLHGTYKGKLNIGPNRLVTTNFN